MARNKVGFRESPTILHPPSSSCRYMCIVYLQEVAVVLLDVGPLMNPIREFAEKAICGFLQSKVRMERPSE